MANLLYSHHYQTLTKSHPNMAVTHTTLFTMDVCSPEIQGKNTSMQVTEEDFPHGAGEVSANDFSPMQSLH